MRASVKAPVAWKEAKPWAWAHRMSLQEPSGGGAVDRGHKAASQGSRAALKWLDDGIFLHRHSRARAGLAVCTKKGEKVKRRENAARNKG